MIIWLKSQPEWSVEHLHDYLATTYGVVFQSRQSYYQLLADAEINYKQAQRSNPKGDPERVAAKKAIIDQLSAHATAIMEGSIVVLYPDECHLIWDDARGYGWGQVHNALTCP